MVVAITLICFWGGLLSSESTLAGFTSPKTNMHTQNDALEML